MDLILKKVKHRVVENMSSSTADALGLSRAILCNDSLLKKLDELKRMESMYRGLVEVSVLQDFLEKYVLQLLVYLQHSRRLLRSYYDLCQTYKGSKMMNLNDIVLLIVFTFRLW